MSDELWEALWIKHGTLYEYLQYLNGMLLPADRPHFEGHIRNVELEILRIEAVMSMMANGAAIPMPSDKDIKALQIATGQLQQAVRAGNAVIGLLAAADAVIKTWPVS